MKHRVADKNCFMASDPSLASHAFEEDAPQSVRMVSPFPSLDIPLFLTIFSVTLAATKGNK